MKITLNVEEKDGLTYRVTTNLFSIVALERKFKIRASDLASGVAMEHLAFLAFEGAKQEGFTVPAVLTTTSSALFRWMSWRKNLQTLRARQLPQESLRVSR